MEIVNARNAWSCDWGDPYQMASVPQSTRCSPTRLSNLPRVCAAVVGLRSTSRQTVPTSTHTLSFGGTACTSSAAQERVDADGGVRVVGAFDVVLVPSAVEDDELHIRELARNGDDVVGTVVRRVEPDERESLVRDEDPHAEVVRLLDDRETDRRVVEREAVLIRAPRGVDLERGHLCGSRSGLHLVEPSVQVTEVRRDHVVHQHSRRAAVRELGGQLLGSELIQERHRRVGRAGVRDVREHGDRRVAREEEVVEIRGAAGAFEPILGGARGDHPEDQLHGVRCVLRPGAVGHHVMRVYVDDELAVAAQGVLAGLDVVGRRDGERSPGSRHSGS